jgi:hypothetical protein
VVDVELAADVARRHLTGTGELAVVQRSDEHVVFDTGDAIVGALGAFYRTYRQAWVVRLDPGAAGTPNPALARLREQLDAR